MVRWGKNIAGRYGHERTEAVKNKQDSSTSPIKLRFHGSNGMVDQTIDDLMQMARVAGETELIREMIITALKAGQEGKEKADLKLMSTTLKEMRFTSKVFGPYRNVRKVTVFGSARTRPEDPAYAAAVIFGKKLREAGYMVITGGGPGIMQAVNEGAGPDYSFGINIRLPSEQKTNPVLYGNPKSIVYKYFFNRKVAFLKEAHAVALFPGGFGTLDEAMETLTLVQTGKRYPIPLILIDPPGRVYWVKWLNFLKTELMNHGYISPMDFNLFERVDSVDAAVARIDTFYKRYHNLRYVEDKIVIRMTSKIDHERVKYLESAFSDMLIPDGKIRQSGPLPEETDEPHIAHLPRLIVDFNLKSFGRLRMLIDAINGIEEPGSAQSSFPFSVKHST
jgi:hypothetical protein